QPVGFDKPALRLRPACHRREQLMGPDKLIERIKAVDISPIIEIVGGLPFVAVNVGSTDPGKSPCSVAFGRLPAAVYAFVEGLKLGGETMRIVFRKLAPHQGMPPHIDSWMPDEVDWRRFQVPIVSHPDIKMRWPLAGVEEHLEPGFLYEVRFDR